MKHEDFNFPQHGFAGHLAEPDEGSDRAVIVIMGGEQSLLPGIKFAERFADYGITGLAFLCLAQKVCRIRRTGSRWKRPGRGCC